MYWKLMFTRAGIFTDANVARDPQLLNGIPTMTTMLRRCVLFVSYMALLPTSLISAETPDVSKPPSGDTFPAGWSAESPRDEIRPEFSFEPKGGPKKAGSFVIRHDEREALDGWFQKTFAVTGGKSYRFNAVRKLTD